MDEDSIELLAAAYPYLSASFKGPVSTFLKAQEIRRIMDSDELLQACELNPGNVDLEQMLLAMKQRASPTAKKQIDTILNMLQVLKFYQEHQELIQLASSISQAGKPAKEAETDPLMLLLQNFKDASK